MKTQIKKFLWFDITPRKELYNEIDECYAEIAKIVKKLSALQESLAILREEGQSKNNQINSLENQLCDAEKQIMQLKDDLSWSERLSSLKDYDIERLTEKLREYGYDDDDCGCDCSY
jgi:chromosome segregation ATPase